MRKQCSKCHIEKPIKAFSKDPSSKDGYHLHCKDCVKEAIKSKPHILAESKVCSGCHLEKLASEFHRNRYLPDGLQNYCKTCTIERTDRQKVRDRVRVYQNNLVGMAEIPEEKLCRTCNRVLPAKEFTRWKYSKTGLVSQCKECFKVKHGAKALENGRKYNGKPGVRRDSKNRRKARKRNAPRIEQIRRLKVYERDEGKCYICSKELPFDNFDLEHVIPLSRGGCHTYDNVKVACRTCNVRKHTKLLEEL